MVYVLSISEIRESTLAAVLPPGLRYPPTRLNLTAAELRDCIVKHFRANIATPAEDQGELMDQVPLTYSGVGVQVVYWKVDMPGLSHQISAKPPSVQ